MSGEDTYSTDMQRVNYFNDHEPVSDYFDDPMIVVSEEPRPKGTSLWHVDIYEEDDYVPRGEWSLEGKVRGPLTRVPLAGNYFLPDLEKPPARMRGETLGDVAEILVEELKGDNVGELALGMLYQDMLPSVRDGEYAVSEFGREDSEAYLEKAGVTFTPHAFERRHELGVEERREVLEEMYEYICHDALEESQGEFSSE